MDYYSAKITVDTHDVDYNGVVGAGTLMRYLQSSAELQLTDKGFSYDELRKRNKAFILSKIKLEFNEAALCGEPITAETFPCTSRGYTFIRCYRLLRDGKVIGRAVSAWALIDTQSHALVRVNDFELGLTTYTPLDLPLERTVMPKDLPLVGKYSVNYIDLDRNRHMNNTRYPDMYSNFLPLDGKRISAITINYLNEARMGDTLDIYMKEENGAYYIRSVRPDGKVNSEAEIHLTAI